MASIQCNFYSETLGISTDVSVILPERNAPPYPVLYLLHGMGDDHVSWVERTRVRALAEARGIAVVMPACDKSFYANMAAGLRYWDFLSVELPAVMNQLFPLLQAREDTFAAGNSMGGYGAFKLAFRQPERFAAAASLSGVLDVAGWALQNPQGEHFIRAFGDPRRLTNTEHDLFRLTADLTKAGASLPDLYICCGTEDFLYDGNRKFLSHLHALEIPVTYEESSGAHTWEYWDQWIERIIEWLPVRHQMTNE